MFKVHRGLITQSAVEPFWVIEGFDVIEDGQLSLAMGLEVLLMEPFGFEGTPEGLHGGVVVAIARRTHAGKGFSGGKEPAILRAGVLATPV